MTDFAQEPLWEEENQEPDLMKPPKSETLDPMIAAGNTAMTQVMPPPKPPAKQPKPTVQLPDPTPAPVAAQPVKEPPTEPLSLEPEAKDKDEAAADWETPLALVLSHMPTPDLAEALAALLQMAHAIPEAKVEPVAAAIVSAFLALPAEARKPARDILVTALKRWPGITLSGLILTRLGGVPAPPPPAPPAPPGGP